MNEQELQQVEQEMKELEQQLALENWLISEEGRYFTTLKHHLLRNGYRFLPPSADSRILQIIHIISGEWVMNVSFNELRYARIGAEVWVMLLDRQHKRNKEERRRIRIQTAKEHNDGQ